MIKNKTYDLVRDDVLKLRMDVENYELKADIEKIYKFLKIKEYTTNDLPQLNTFLNQDVLNKIDDAFLVRIQDSYFVFINKKKKPARIRFSRCHEIGHILLDNKKYSNNTDEEKEKLANYAARELLTPSVLVAKYVRENKSIIDIEDDFYVSYTVA